MLQHYEFTRSSPYDRAFITGELSIILHHSEMCHNKNLEYENIWVMGLVMGLHRHLKNKK